MFVEPWYALGGMLSHALDKMSNPKPKHTVSGVALVAPLGAERPPAGILMKMTFSNISITSTKNGYEGLFQRVDIKIY